MSTKPLKVKVSISLDPDVCQRARELAEADSRNLSSLINLLLQNHINNIDKNFKK